MVYEHFLYSGAAGVAATLVAHPLDTWAVHRQTNRKLVMSPKYLYRGIVPAAMNAR